MARVADSSAVLLIVDDGPTGQSFQHALETATVAVEWARTASELRSRAARDDLRTPQVVFLDLELTDATGEDLVRFVRARFPRAAVVALAGSLSGEDAARLLWDGVPTLNKPVSPIALAGLALRLSSQWSWAPPWGPGPNGAPSAVGENGSGNHRGAHLESIFSRYATERLLSEQQRRILRMYLSGKNDKEIARTFQCSEATIYEHWRRMAKKVGGSHKGDVITDFHRFLGSD